MLPSLSSFCASVCGKGSLEHLRKDRSTVVQGIRIYSGVCAGGVLKSMLEFRKGHPTVIITPLLLLSV